MVDWKFDAFRIALMIKQNDKKYERTMNEMPKVAYCPTCGSIVNPVGAGEFVIVSPRGERPYIAQVISIVNEDGKSYAQVLMNAVEKAKVPIESISRTL